MAADPKNIDGPSEVARFAKLTFDRFRDLATNPSLSEHEKIGSPDSIRAGFESEIWNDIVGKVPPLRRRGAVILDIGPGCGPLARRTIEHAETHDQRLVLVDHEEMLSQLPASAAVINVNGRFPDNSERIATVANGGFDAILTYSVLQHVILDSNAFAFVDAAMGLLNPGGHLFIGDIPNLSKLRRFLSSESGASYHRSYMKTDKPPDVPPFALASDRIDDGLLIGLVLRARLAGFDAYLLPQAATLPLANRREDLLIVRP